MTEQAWVFDLAAAEMAAEEMQSKMLGGLRSSTVSARAAATSTAGKINGSVATAVLFLGLVERSALAAPRAARKVNSSGTKGGIVSDGGVGESQRLIAVPS